MLNIFMSNFRRHKDQRNNIGIDQTKVKANINRTVWTKLSMYTPWSWPIVWTPIFSEALLLSTPALLFALSSLELDEEDSPSLEESSCMSLEPPPLRPVVVISACGDGGRGLILGFSDGFTWLGLILFIPSFLCWDPWWTGLLVFSSMTVRTGDAICL